MATALDMPTMHAAQTHDARLIAKNNAAAQAGKRPGFFVRTYGCQMNVRESEGISQILTNLGFEPVGESSADIIVYNTCAVRKSAEDKIMGHLSRTRAAKKARPELFVAFGGCMSQAGDATAFAKANPYVNLVFGTTNASRFSEYILQAMESGRQVIATEFLEDAQAAPRGTRKYPHKADVIISTGCSNSCSYCIVPYARGPHRSRPAADILEECRILADEGVREVTLLGQNVNAFGKQSADFARLLDEICKIHGILRVRFVTSHPKDFSEELIHALQNQPKLANSVHLPLQSGSTNILRQMNRGYTKEGYLGLVQKLRNAIPDIRITTDIIVAYPTETEEDFQHTLDVCETCQFDGAFTFIFSPRDGTPAAALPTQLPKDVVGGRFKRLLDTLHPMFHMSNKRKFGQTLDVMVDEEAYDVMLDTRMGINFNGRTTDNTIVYFTSSKPLAPGSIVPVHITATQRLYVNGIHEE